MVNARDFPGPALWQGLMFCLLPVWIAAGAYKSGRYFVSASWAYGLSGLVLAVAIATWG